MSFATNALGGINIMTLQRNLPMRGGVVLALIALGMSAIEAPAQAPAPTEAAQAMVGAWEISNAARDKTCTVIFALDAGERGFMLELVPDCAADYSSIKDVVDWGLRPKALQ